MYLFLLAHIKSGRNGGIDHSNLVESRYVQIVTLEISKSLLSWVLFNLPVLLCFLFRRCVNRFQLIFVNSARHIKKHTCFYKLGLNTYYVLWQARGKREK